MTKRLTKDEFVERARKVHGDKYDYSRVNYTNYDGKVTIVCPIHGKFEQTVSNHLSGKGCPTCGITSRVEKKTKSKESFISASNNLYGNKYDYSLVSYVNRKTKVNIICNQCGTIFSQTPNEHINGHCGCPICKTTNKRDLFAKTKDDFIKQAKEIHGNKYDYSKVVYVNARTKVLLTCPVHGEFYIRPYRHINEKRGCQHCKFSKGEDEITIYLKKHNITFETQYKVINENLFCEQHFFLVDFFLKDYNTFIEYNGGQHYRPVELFGGIEKFKLQQERDMALRQYCKEHGIRLIEIPYWDYDNIETILNKELDINKVKK